jgi:hypothetical protein
MKEMRESGYGQSGGWTYRIMSRLNTCLDDGQNTGPIWSACARRSTSRR